MSQNHAKLLFIQRKIAGDFDPFLVFQKLQLRGGEAFLLEGFEEWEGGSPYSYIGIDPFESVLIQNGTLEIHRPGGVEVISGDGFKNLVQYLKNYEAPSRKEREIPFRGGAVGFVSYEASALFEGALRHQFDGLERDGIPQAFFMLFRGVVAVSKNKDHVVISQGVFLEKEDFKPGVLRAEGEIQKLETELLKPSPYSSPCKPFDREKAFKINPDDVMAVTSLGRAKFQAGVKKIKEHIRKGDIFQAVLSDRFQVESSINPIKIYEQLRQVNPSPFMFYLATRFGTILGASPERLVKVTEDGLVETNPIAGTRPRGHDKKEDLKNEKELLKDIKENAEHLMLVDLGRNDVGRISETGGVKVEEFMAVKRFSDVMHLVSKIRGRLAKSRSPWDALASTFPAGTLSGAPKIRAMEILSQIEMTPRLFYGGAIVKYEFGGDLDSCIAIRCGHIRDDKITLQSGAGIVADSVAKKEYDEVLAKSRALRRAIILALKNEQSL